MNKILTLYDLEFKRVKKVYFSILSLLTLSNISLFIFYLYFLQYIKIQLYNNCNIKYKKESSWFLRIIIAIKQKYSSL